MKQLLTLTVVFYRWAIKPFYKRTCLFRVSCSEEVLNETRRLGFAAGMQVLNTRIKYCRPGYQWSKNPVNGAPRLIFQDGKYLEENEISIQMLAKNRQ